MTARRLRTTRSVSDHTPTYPAKKSALDGIAGERDCGPAVQLALPADPCSTYQGSQGGSVNIYLSWHTDTEDITLGEGYVEVLPPVGALIAYVPLDMPEPRQVSWRVTAVLITPAAPGSMAVLHRRHEQLGVYHVFVEPAEGPFHP